MRSVIMREMCGIPSGTAGQPMDQGHDQGLEQLAGHRLCCACQGQQHREQALHDGMELRGWSIEVCFPGPLRPSRIHPCSAARTPQITAALQHAVAFVLQPTSKDAENNALGGCPACATCKTWKVWRGAKACKIWKVWSRAKACKSQQSKHKGKCTHLSSTV